MTEPILLENTYNIYKVIYLYEVTNNYSECWYG